MLTIIENYSWIIILPVFVLLFAVIWNALKKSSIFPEPACFVIALCVAILCVVSVIEYFPQEHKNSQEVAAISQEDASPQKPQKRNFFFLLLPYLALTISFLLLLIVVEIGLLAEGKSNLFRLSYRKKNKVATTDRRKGETQINKVKSKKSR